MIAVWIITAAVFKILLGPDSSSYASKVSAGAGMPVHFMPVHFCVMLSCKSSSEVKHAYSMSNKSDGQIREKWCPFEKTMSMFPFLY